MRHRARRSASKARLNQVAGARKSIEHAVIGAGAGALLGGIFGGGKGAEIGSVIGGAGGLGTTALHGHQKITLSCGQEMLIRITGR